MNGASIDNSKGVISYNDDENLNTSINQIRISNGNKKKGFGIISKIMPRKSKKIKKDRSTDTPNQIRKNNLETLDNFSED